jgi:O-methyltransferase
MQDNDLQKLVDDAEQHAISGKGSIAVLHLSDIALRFLERFRNLGLLACVSGVHSVSSTHGLPAEIHGVPLLPLSGLMDSRSTAIVVAADTEKENVILEALPHITGVPKLIVAGYGHYLFHDPLFEEVRGETVPPSLANGYPNSLVHIYQCLCNAARLHLTGVVVELGMFKGGTSMFISQLVERLCVDWRVMAFDSFTGFPPRRSPLDMYDEPACVFTNVEALRRLFARSNVEIVSGDITQTSSRLADHDLVLTFFDTDNYSPARAALEVVREKTVTNGAIIFDHFTGTDRFRYTLGERLAARSLLDDPRYFNLHGTGVFIRQR